MGKTIKKLCKALAQRFPCNSVRLSLLRIAGYCVGDSVYIGEDFLVIDHLSCTKNIILEDRVSIAPRVSFVTDSGPNNSRIAAYTSWRSGIIRVCNDAWIGTGVVIMPGVTIGECAIVGAGSVVTKNVEPFTVVVGAPAKKIKEFVIGVTNYGETPGELLR